MKITKLYRVQPKRYEDMLSNLKKYIVMKRILKAVTTGEIAINKGVL